MALTPSLILRIALLRLHAEWEFYYDGLQILTTPLLGMTYRYAIRLVEIQIESKA